MNVHTTNKTRQYNLDFHSLRKLYFTLSNAIESDQIYMKKKAAWPVFTISRRQLYLGMAFKTQMKPTFLSNCPNKV